jgi:hypothetical protein
MKIIRNNIIPFRGFSAINLFGILFVRKEAEIDATVIRHEKIHSAQIVELGYIFFYILYVLEWLFRLIKHGKSAYRNISFEREAYYNQQNKSYLHTRKSYSFLRYL